MHLLAQMFSAVYRSPLGTITPMNYSSSDSLPLQSLSSDTPAPEPLSSEASTPVRGTPRPALPRYQRAKEAPPMKITSRDVALLEDVWRFGLLTTSQLKTLRASDPDPELRFVSDLTLTRRLKLLFHHRYLRRIARPLAQGSLEPVYVLDHAGARELSLRHGEVSARPPSRLPKAAGLDHLLEVVAMRVALAAAPPEAGLQLLEWRPGERVRFRVAVEAPGQRRHNVSLIPDAGLVVRALAPARNPEAQETMSWQRHYAFLEVDRGTEAARHLTSKVRAYLAYWKSGGFARDFSVPPALGFWVLFVAPTPKRAETILKAIAAVEGPKVIFRVALAAEITPERIAQPVWRDGASPHLGHFWEMPLRPQL